MWLFILFFQCLNEPSHLYHGSEASLRTWYPSTWVPSQSIKTALIFDCNLIFRPRRSIGEHGAQDSPSLLKKLNNYVWVPRDCTVETVSCANEQPDDVMLVFLKLFSEQKSS